MKKIILMFTAIIFALSVKAQENLFEPLDSSPADIVYFPVNAAKTKEHNTPVMKVIYSRPHRKGRTIFGGLEQYGKVWRAGANENTEIKFYKDVKIGDKTIKAGTYGLYAIPEKDKWTFIINTKIDTWGAYSYEQSKDVVRVQVPVETLSKPIEDLSIGFKENAKGANLILAWDTVQMQLPVEF